jgi:hypothetical protein
MAGRVRGDELILFYIDESGTGLGDKRTPFFVLSAVGIAARDWSRIDSEVVSLKRRLVSWAKPEDWEIKGRDLRRGQNFFKGQNWHRRSAAFNEIADLVSRLPCQIFSVQVDKRLLPEYVATESDLYRVAFWRLLEELDALLERENENGMLLVDMRSDMHTSVQDRRLIDAYRDWLGLRSGRTRFAELPWFGFSAFYAGLQLADFVSYLIDFVSNEMPRSARVSELQEAYNTLLSKIRRVKVP